MRRGWGGEGGREARDDKSASRHNRGEGTERGRRMRGRGVGGCGGGGSGGGVGGGRGGGQREDRGFFLGFFYLLGCI